MHAKGLRTSLLVYWFRSAKYKVQVRLSYCIDTIFISELTEYDTLFPMANQCPICFKPFKSKIALRDHTGTADPTLRKPHVCCKCDTPFCSQRAMEHHRDWPNHPTFNCSVCNRPFESKRAVTDHQKSLKHDSMVEWEEL